MVVLLATLLGAGVYCPALHAAGEAAAREEVVVQANRELADEQVTLHLQQVLSDDRWIYAEHVTITTENGVVRVEGVVADSLELLRVLHLCNKIPGVKRVDTSNLEINAQLPDGG
ncbi:MAG TPA: BON domain-containing protein [Steroidobacteraceae bacterium]